MEEGRRLPRNADYRDVLPKAIESQSKRRTYFPVNGNTFTSTGNNIIRIDITGDAFLDTRNSYLTFQVTNNTGQAFSPDSGGGHTFLRRVRTEQAGNILTDCNSYNKLLSSILIPAQGSRDSVQHRSLTENGRWLNGKGNGNSANVQIAASVSGASLTTPAQGGGLILNNAAGVPATAGSQATFCIPLINGLLGVGQDKLIPLQLLGSSPITLEIEICPTLDIGIWAAAPAAGVAYQIDNVRYVAAMVETSPQVDAQVRMIQEMSDGQIMLNGVDYTHFNGNIAANATGQQSINVPARRRSIKSLFFVGASQTFGAGATAQDQLFNMSFGGHFNMTDFSIKIGSVQYPPTPIECNYGLAAGPLGSRSEHAAELEKSFGTLSSTTGLGSLCSGNFARTNCNVASMTTIVAPGAPDASYNYCPFALDLEAFQRVATSDGVNTADRATPITLQLNIGLAAAEAINVDCYVSYDSIYYIDSVGSIRVSF